MPIVDIELVAEAEPVFETQALADALGKVLGTPPGRTWVRLRWLSSQLYAENDALLDAAELPAFVSILHAHAPTGAALATELKAITETIALCVSRPVERVHVQYAPAGAGRQAFGGRLVQ